jgi:hypothetical protein
MGPHSLTRAKKYVVRARQIADSIAKSLGVASIRKKPVPDEIASQGAEELTL